MISFISHVVLLFFLVVPFHCSVTVNDDAKSVFENFKLLLNDRVGNDAVEAVTRLREESFTQVRSENLCKLYIYIYIYIYMFLIFEVFIFYTDHSFNRCD